MPRVRVPDSIKRVAVFARVYPKTKEYLDSLGEPNHGRAIDRLVEMHRSIVRAMKPEARMQFEPPVPLPRVIDQREDGR